MGNAVRPDVWEDFLMTAIAPPPKSPSVSDQVSHTFRPEETNPDLAAAAMVKDMMAKFPTPAITTKKFNVYQAIVQSLNHSEENPTYFNSTMLSAVFDRAAATSVNQDGALFKNFWAYMMHPNYIIQGMPQMPTQEEQPGLIARLLNKVRGQPTENKQP